MHSNLLSTDAHCLVIVLGEPCNMVDFTWSSVARSIGVSRCTCLNKSVAKLQFQCKNNRKCTIRICQWIIMCEVLCWNTTYQRHMPKLANVMPR